MALKFSLMHLCMEYPNSENRARIGMKKDKFCDICREVGIEVVDSTEHNLFTCECLRGETYAAKQRQEAVESTAQAYNDKADDGDIAPIYRFGEGVLEGNDLTLTDREISVPGFEQAIELSDDNPFGDMT